MLEFEAAIDDYSKAISILRKFPNKFDVPSSLSLENILYKRGEVFLLLHQHASALKDFNEVIKINPLNQGPSDNPDNPYYYRSIIFNEMNEIEKSLKNINTAIKLNPGTAQMWFYRGKLLLEEFDMVDKGLLDVNKALSLNPYHEKALLLRGYFLWQKKDEITQSVKDFTTLILHSEDPSYVYEALCFRATIMLGCGVNVYGVISEFSKAIKVDPSRNEGFFARGMAYFRIKNYDLAIKDCDSVLKLESLDNDVLEQTYILRGESRFFNSNYIGAMEDVSKAIDLNSQIEDYFELRDKIVDKLKEKLFSL